MTVSEDGYVNRASPAAGFGTDSLPDKTSHAWHWNGYGADHLSGGFQTLNTPDQNSYCTFGLNWTEGKLDFYVDRQLVHTHTGNEVCAVPSFMIFSGQLGGYSVSRTLLA